MGAVVRRKEKGVQANSPQDKIGHSFPHREQIGCYIYLQTTQSLHITEITAYHILTLHMQDQGQVLLLSPLLRSLRLVSSLVLE